MRVRLFKLIKKLKKIRWERMKVEFYQRRDSLAKKLVFESQLDNWIDIYAMSPLRWNVERVLAPSSLRILYVATKYSGSPGRGLSYEENNFLHTLVNMGYKVIHFDFKAVERKLGRSQMNKMLLECVYRYQPHLMFTVLIADELDKKIIKEISDQTDTLTFNWFCDDHWRFDNYSKYWAPIFNWISTTDENSAEKYKELGYKNVVSTQWACNHLLYRPLRFPKIYDVSFIGTMYGERLAVLGELKRAGINVNMWGYGSRAGRLSVVDMIKVFNQSKINLNINNSSVPGINQIKGRNFEIPGCKAFSISGYVPGFEKYYNIGKEVVCYYDVDELIQKVKYYLPHHEERENIAKAGYKRTLREHTYEKRFNEIFKKIGL